MKRTLILLFILHIITRLVFISFVGIFNNFELQGDSAWLVDFGLKAAGGNFNFTLERFIASPLYPALIGFFKLIFNENWKIILILFQLFISALSGVYIYKIALLLFDNRNIGLIASLIFSVFPLTLWYTNTFSQECIFQALFIFSIFYLIKSIKTRRLKFVIISAVLFSLAYLTKSHILLFSIFIPVIYFHYFKFRKETFMYSFTFAFVALLFSVPYGLYNYKINNDYIISSNGAGYQFYLGNTEAGYKTVVDVPGKGTEDYVKLKDINVTAGYFNGSQSHYDYILSLPQKLKQKLFFNEGLAWIKNNPIKFLKLKVYDTLFFLLPGVSWRHYSFYNWLFAFIISFPIYLLAYLSIIKLIQKRDKAVIPIIYIFLSMLLFSTVWYVQNRFRTVTIEPFYIIYASFFLNYLIEKMPVAKKILTAVSLFFHPTKSDKILTA